MIVGTGLMAHAFRRYVDVPWACIYAAGVSNSGCKEAAEFDRERIRLDHALASARSMRAFVYFSTCSIGDPDASTSLYVRHKLAMEEMVRGRHSGHLIARLPQVAGRTPNPHTLLNYLYARIARSEQFFAWSRATRNVIDVDDVETTVSSLLAQRTAAAMTVNVANPHSVTVAQIVTALELVVGKSAVVQWIDAGTRYEIDINDVEPIFKRLKMPFDPGYVLRVLTKYYALLPGSALSKATSSTEDHSTAQGL